MKATVEYNLPEDSQAYKIAVMSDSLAMALWELEEYLRGVEKWERADGIIEIRAKFYDILTQYGINLDDLIE